MGFRRQDGLLDLQFFKIENWGKKFYQVYKGVFIADETEGTINGIDSYKLLLFAIYTHHVYGI